MTATSSQANNQHVPMRTINTLLVANRGEIAVRVMRTAASMGMRTIAVYSDADAGALHVKAADLAFRIGTAQPSESYLNIAAVIDAAKKAGADAIHPGYGFLSENPDFVEACEAANIVFVGPDAQAMRSMGLKDAAKALMEKAGVPVVPGYHGDNQDTTFLAEQAAQIEYPVLIKARAGGGGKGMRKVDQPEDFVAALEAAQREGLSSFGDAAVLIEKYIAHPRHIEVQVFGDRHGNYVHLFERDCSLQRRHQKVIEEAPAPDMTPELRDAMTKAAIRTAESINYVGAGTVEFIVDASGPLRSDGFWFMEMNTRLQVEHPVTEAVTGFDLVQWQLQVATGHPLPVQQSEIVLQGHSVEARLYAEDVSAGFLPATGTLHRFTLSEQAGRVDTGVAEGDLVQPYYDPMLAKLVAHGPDRDSAFRQLHRMLDNSEVLGVTSNRAFLAQLCLNNAVLAGQVHTHFIEQSSTVGGVTSAAETESAAPVFDANAALAAVISVGLINSEGALADRQATVFSQLGVWQLWGYVERRVTLLCNHQTLILCVRRQSNTEWRVALESAEESNPVSNNIVNGNEKASATAITLNVPDLPALKMGTSILVDGVVVRAVGMTVHDTVYCRVGSDEAQFKRVTVKHADSVIESGSHLLSPMPGRIIAVHCQAGDTVRNGDVLITLEAMKMEHSLIAAADTRVDTVLVAENDQVEHGMPLVLFAEPTA